MLVMQDCAIEPGDIVFVVSNSSKPFIRLKQAAQALTTPGNKHGHREVVTVFVCTDRNKYGVICHNYERQLSVPTETFSAKLQEKTIEELTTLLLKYCDKEFNSIQIKEALSRGTMWMRQLAAKMTGSEDPEKLIEQFLAASKENKERLIQLVLVFWRASGQAEILPVVNSSLLVFKHNDTEQRQQFLRAYQQQIKVTERFHAQGKSRTSFWAVLKSLFQWSNQQDKEDREHLAPSDATFCSSNVMQVLNQVNPDLVHRGRYVLPKTLEAGLREATKSKKRPEKESPEQFDDFEEMVAAQEQWIPPFKLQILPASGKKLMSTLLAAVDKEIQRIESKWWLNQADRDKASDLKRCLLPFRNPKYQGYSVELQVDIALELIATLLPALQKKTGLLGEWFPSTSYTNIRAFARTQGIFDGDIRDTVEKLKTHSSITSQEEIPAEDVQEPLPTGQIYIFSDWSFSIWPTDKRAQLLQYMNQLVAKGHALYTWENGQLVKMNKESLKSAINGEDFDDLLASKLKPATRAAVLKQAEYQQLNTAQVHFLDYKVCQELADDHKSIETHLNVASIFSSKQDEYHLNQTKLALIDIELANTEDENEQLKLQKLKKQIATLNDIKHKTYQSGVDTKAFVTQPRHRKPIFKPVDLLTFTPSTKYYRDEVYSDLLINENPSSPFQYYELVGMNATENLTDCDYEFHPEGLSEELINKRKDEANLVLLKGKKRLSLTSNWQPLPSVHPGETLLDIAINGLKKDDFEIKYSKENRLHYIRLLKPTTEPKEAKINFLLRMPKQYRAHPVFNTLTAHREHQEIHRLLMKYLKFGKDHGKLRNTKVHNGNEYLDEARGLAVGSCRLRAIAFKEEMKRLYPKVPVSIVGNPDHCFIEMELDGQWDRYCLGGYRDTPSLVESVKEDTLSSMNSDAKNHRFFAEKAKPQLPVEVPVAEEEFVKRFA